MNVHSHYKDSENWDFVKGSWKKQVIKKIVELRGQKRILSIL